MRKVCFYNLDTITKAMEYFTKTYNIPIEDKPENLSSYDTVFFSLLSFRDFYKIARLAKHKGQSEWIAGGNAVANPVAIMWIMDYIYLGDAFFSFERILKGERDMAGMLNCKKPAKTQFQIEKPLPCPMTKNEIILSKGCKRRCLFCVNAWKSPYQENDFNNIEAFLKSDTGKNVFLSSNSSDDVSYYSEKIIPLLQSLNKIDKVVSNSIGGITEEYIINKKSEMLFGVEGMSERLRHVINKPIATDKLLETIDMCVKHDRIVRTVHQFNLPSESEKDFLELINNIEYISKKHNKKGLWRIPFIPNHPDPHTPLQWEKPYYSLEMWQRITELQQRYMKDMKDDRVKIFIPNVLSSGSQFTEIITDWIPVTPKICTIANKILKQKNMPFEYYQELFKDNGVDVDFIFTQKDKDYQFLWDDLVEIYTPKEQLWHMKEIMDRKISKI